MLPYRSSASSRLTNLLSFCATISSSSLSWSVSPTGASSSSLPKSSAPFCITTAWFVMS
ncbi:hypothetical protein PF001_g11956 [Phytophthora fragariae]|uniref:Uncharacterized protein n=1 Tax=Phytophthora fragariae TaxID=53985 RepID=A0A6A4DE19_9STRA|nr:hypothetical protein PF009_g16179 [Phytophthora fragariae]KAE9226388.1 hypothetical protein PF004_g11654 [Phytophthora fragariae]KAE9306756.1 hypothetical protein PF001_g11956 [Phytophthora fragariae]